MAASLPLRTHPLQTALDHLHPTWGELDGMPVPLDFGNPQAEREQAKTLALSEATALNRVVWKGPTAETFLTEQKISVPAAIFQSLPLPKGGVIVRTGSSEFFIEDGPGGTTVSALDAAYGAGKPGAYRVCRQDASLLLSGSRATEVLLQTCGVDLREAKPALTPDPSPNSGRGEMLVMSRVAGVSCSILSRELNGIPVFQLWMDGSYGLYLWETLLEIVRDLQGGAAGMACFFPEIAGGLGK